MTAPASFETILADLRAAHLATPALRTFCPFPTDLIETSMMPYHIGAADLMASDSALNAASPLARAIIAAGPDAHWRETYKGTDIGGDFLSRFGCYAIIGPNAPWTSETFAAFMVYMPAGLWYPYHQHPAEELYYILAGSAEFLAAGKAPQIAKAGDGVFHATSQPHATRTLEEPLLALVLWRNHFGTRPVLCPAPDDTLQRIDAAKETP